MKILRCKTARILDALMSGKKLTPQEANNIGGTTEGTRVIRRLREDYPILKEPVAGKNYYRYYIDPEWLKSQRDNEKKPLRKKLETFFDDLMGGGMLEEAMA